MVCYGWPQNYELLGKKYHLLFTSICHQLDDTLRNAKSSWESQVLLSPLGPSLVQVWAVLNLAWNDRPKLPIKTGHSYANPTPLGLQYHSDSNTLPNVITNMAFIEKFLGFRLSPNLYKIGRLLFFPWFCFGCSTFKGNLEGKDS